MSFPFLDSAACAAVTVEDAKVQVRDGHAVHSDQSTLDRGRLKRVSKRNLMKPTDHNSQIRIKNRLKPWLWPRILQEQQLWLTFFKFEFGAAASTSENRDRSTQFFREMVHIVSIRNPALSRIEAIEQTSHGRSQCI